MVSKIRDVIAEYYRRIDRDDTAWVMELFADHAVYLRADAIYSGKDDIGHFFREKRQIRGEHVIETLWAVPAQKVVVAMGQFEGVGAKGDLRKIGFSDFWFFNDCEQVSQRRTYLAIGNKYVEA